MKICVCVKAVPDANKITFDAKKGTLKRTGKEMTINPCDAVAVEAGIRFARENNGTLSAVSMGPTDAGLRTALAMGAEEAYLLSSGNFAGADVPATAYTLSCFFKKHSEFDVIFCGKHSADGDTGQTGAMLAEYLKIPHVCGVREILSMKEGKLRVIQNLGDEELLVEIKMPCLLVVQNSFCIPGTPTLRGTLKAKQREIVIEDENSLNGLELSRCGLSGSATRVVRMLVPKNTRETQKIKLHETDKLRKILRGWG